MKSLKTVSFWNVLLISLLIVSLIPIIYISMFNHSCADDYTYGLFTSTAWNESHNIIHLLKGSFDAMRYYYYGWQGTWSAIFLMSLQPGIFGETYYFLSSIILLGVIIGGTCFFFRTITKTFFGRPDIGQICGLGVLLVSIQLLPSAVEGFFWWNGSSFYVIFHSLLLVFVGMILKILAADDCSCKKMLGISILGLFIGGGNYVDALLAMEFLIFCMMLCILQKKKVFWKLAVISICAGIGFIISVTAPGNAVRQSRYSAMNPIRAILLSYVKAYQWMTEWSTPFLFLLIVFLVPFIIKLHDQKHTEMFQMPLWCWIVFLFSFFASSFTPTLYAMGYEGEGRTQNIRFFLWIIVCVLTEIIVIGKVINYVKKHERYESVFELFTVMTDKEILSGAGLVIGFGLFFFFSNYASEQLIFTSVSAVKSIYNGEAKAYDEEAEERFAKLLGKEKVVELEEFTVRPYVLFFSDLDYDSGNWTNIAAANYFGKDKVILKQAD